MIILNNIRWISYQGVLVPDEIPDKDINLKTEEIKYLLKKSGTYFIRWETNFDCGYETEYWHIIKDKVSTLESLSGNTRHNIRRGLNRCIIKKIPAKEVAEFGYESYIKAFRKYNTFIKPETNDEFIKNILKKENDPEWEFWGVWNLEQKMIAYAINRVSDNRCFYKTTKFHPDYLKLYTSDALFFIMNTHYLDERSMKYVDDGPRSLSHQTNIQEYFINKFEFRRAYSRMHIVYNPKVRFAVKSLYPLKNFLSKNNSSIASKLNVLMKHEEIRRSFK